MGLIIQTLFHFNNVCNCLLHFYAPAFSWVFFLVRKMISESLMAVRSIVTGVRDSDEINDYFLSVYSQI